MPSYTYDSFLWSEREYSIKELLDLFEYQLPFLITTTQGYTGPNQWMNEIAIADVFLLYGIAEKPRIVVKDEQNKCYSIPESYTEIVIPSDSQGKDGPEMKISKMLEDEAYKIFRFKENTLRYAHSGADNSQSVYFGYLEIMEPYIERFLILHTLLSGDVPDPRSTNSYVKTYNYCTEGIYPQFAVIPVYMPIAMAVAVGLAEGPERAFFRTMLGFKNFADKCDHNYKPRLDVVSEIMVYDGIPSSGDYEYIHFLHFIGTNKQEGNISPDGYWAVKDDKPQKKRKQLSNKESTSGPVPKVPPRLGSKLDQNSNRISLTKKGKLHLPNKKGSKSGKTSPDESTLGKVRVPTPPPISDDSDDYEEVDHIEPQGIEQTPLSQRLGPVAVGVDLHEFLPRLRTILANSAVPAPPVPPDQSGPSLLLAQNDQGKYDDTAHVLPFERDPPPKEPSRHLKHSTNHQSKPTPAPRKIYDTHRNIANPPVPQLNSENQSPRKSSDSQPTKKISPHLPISSDSTRFSKNRWQGDSEDDEAAPPVPQKTFYPDTTDQTPSGYPQSIGKKGLIPTPFALGQRAEGKVLQTVSVRPTVQRILSAEKTTESAVKKMPIVRAQAKQAVVAPTLRPKPTKERISRIISMYHPDKVKDNHDHDGSDCMLSMETVAHPSKIPKNIEQFTVEDISKCLKLLNLGDHVEDFAVCQIDGDFITDLNEEILKSEFSFTLLDAKKLIRFINGWRPKYA